MSIILLAWKRIDLLLACLRSLSDTLGRSVTLSARCGQLEAEREQLRARQAAERRQLLARQADLETTAGKLLVRRDQLAAEREQLIARQDGLEATIRELRAYTSAAGFRIVEGVIRRLRSVPVVFKPARGTG